MLQFDIFVGLVLEVHGVLLQEVKQNLKKSLIISMSSRLDVVYVCYLNKGRFCNTTASVTLIHTPIQAISECIQKKCSQAEIQNKRSCKVALKPVRQNLVCCGLREVFKRRYVLITKEEG